MPKPADPLSDTLYDMVSLNRLFFVSSVLLIAVTLWSVWQDYDRNWKHYQRDFNEIAIKRAEKELAALEALLNDPNNEDGKKIRALEAEIATAQEALKGQQSKIEEIQEKQKKILGDLQASFQKFQFDKSEADTLKYLAEKSATEYHHALEHAEELKAKGDAKAAESEMAHAEGLKKSADSASAKFQEKQKTTDESRLVFEKVESEDKVHLNAIKEINKVVLDKTKEKEKLEADLITVKVKLAKLQPSFAKWLLAQPGADFVQNPEQIQQIMLPNLMEDLNFGASVMKIDRCTTCHLAIDKKGWTDSDLKPVFKSHPRLDLFVGDNSPHPLPKFGCTICHGGQGRSVDFYHAGHMPKSAEQGNKWKEEYNWKPISHFDSPMTPTPYMEASCTKCHTSQTRVVMADKLNEGKRLLEKVGCYGCHPIAGTEDLRKPGPGLGGLKHKVTKDWAFNWIKKPSDFRPTTHMPQAFDLSNTSDKDSIERNTALIQGVVEYLFSQTEMDPAPKGYPEPPAGDAVAGKATAKQVGCLACHVVGDVNTKGTEYTNFGPNLSGVGSKLNAGWTFAWLKDPQKYFHYTSMPNLRLTDTEAANVVSYLLSLKHPDKFEEKKMPPVVDADLDKTIFGFMRSAKSAAEAEEEIKKMSQQQKLLWLGDKAVNHFGCFGCHQINKQFDATKKIGAELTGSNSTGTKDITKFDFGYQHDLQWRHHQGSYDRVAWVRAKLENPRIFDEHKIVSYEDRLRMPKFGLTAEEIDQVLTYVISFRREPIPHEYKRNLTHKEAVIDKGKRLIQNANCASCHKVGLFPKTVTVNDDNRDDLSKRNLFLARTVLTDGRQVESISDAELAILGKRGVRILYKKGTWLKADQFRKLQETILPRTDVLVFGNGEGAIEEIVNRKNEEADDNEPPIIVGEGAKVQPGWLFGFLKSPTEIRPWLKNGGVRMPTFGFTDDEARTLVEHFAHLSGEDFPFQYDEPLDPKTQDALIARGKEVFESNKCWSCHMSTDDRTRIKDKEGPHLRIIGGRIQKDWFGPWVRDPQVIAPGVSMPENKVESLAEEDMAAVREYIWSLQKK